MPSCWAIVGTMSIVLEWIGDGPPFVCPGYLMNSGGLATPPRLACSAIRR